MSAAEKTVGSVLVVGGGIAGIQSALDLADSGYFVYLLEKTPAIGGVMSKLDKTFPTNDCAMCIMSPKLVEVGRHVNVEVITKADLVSVEGDPGNLMVKIHKDPRYVDISKCTGCGECEKACPIQITDVFNQGIGQQKVISRPYAQAYPSAFSVRKLDRSPCVVACPAHVNAHGYVALVAQGRYREAMEVIMDVLPLPGTLGRICPHPCEEQCRRCELDEPISIRNLKRLAADQADILDIPVKKKDATDQKVAIIGAGPAGLTAAYHLARAGHAPTIFEALPVPGGMLRVGIPDYRLPPAVLDKEVEAITNLGVEIKYNAPLGADRTIDGLFGEGYKAVFLAMGAHKGMDLEIPGEDTQGVVQGVTYLKELNLGMNPWVGKRVAVIGGGNVAMDVARSTRRLGADVTIAYRRTRAEMPAWEEEIDAALEEGIKIDYLVAPKEVLAADGKVAGLRLIRMELGEPDKSGRRRPVPVDGSEFDLDVDMIIPAIGQRAVIDPAAGLEGVTITRWNTIEVDPVTYATSREGVFAGGDIQTGADIAIRAVQAGKEAAISIDRFLRGEDMKADRAEWALPDEPQWQAVPKDAEKKSRAPMPALAAEERLGSFVEIEKGLTPEEGMADAARCLACGICCECFRCVDACLPGAVTRATHCQQEETVELNVGSVVLAPGFEAYDPTGSLYLYGQHPNVVTSLEFERILSASGPSMGHLIRLGDKKEPKRIAFLQCVGSRDLNHCDNEYCSSVCCMYAIKEAVIAKEHSHEPLEVTIFFMDIRTVGKDFERSYERAKQLGIRFIRSRVHSVAGAADGDLRIDYVTEGGDLVQETFNMIVLAHGLEVPQDTRDMLKRLGVGVSRHNFIEASAFSPVATDRPGIFACGVITGPKDIPYSVMEASAAASAASAPLAKARGTLAREKPKFEIRDVSGERPRIGVFVCHCGINIAGVVRVEEVADYAATLPFVEYVDRNLFTCSQDTQDKMNEIIKTHNLNRLVVAACSPRTHEPLFQDTLVSAGLNKYLFEMANIRNHDSWVHGNDPDGATEKAKDLVHMAVAKAALLTPLAETTIQITPSALVVGGGVAGLNAALAISSQGFRAHVVEREAELGGNALRLAATASGENVAQYLEDLKARVANDPLIEVHKSSSIESLDGFIGNFKTRLSGGEEISHGAVIVATGAVEYQPNEYLYRKHDRVMTLMELDVRLKENESAFKDAKAFAFIQCVGSREPERPYCSKVCCTHSVMSAIELKKINPDARVYVLYRDMRTFGTREVLYREARRQGVIFIRYDVDRKPSVEASGDQLSIGVFDPILGQNVELKVDYLTLASAIVSRRDNDLAQMLKIPMDEDGWFLEAHMKLRPVEFATDGVFLCGLAHYPKPLEEAVAQAQAAASRAVTVLTSTELKLGGVVANISQNRCTGCNVCVTVCPFSAIALDDKNKALVNEALCKGCGTCVSSCRSGAPQLKGFTDAGIFSQIAACF